MVNRKDLIIAVLITFCLTVTVFMVMPIRNAETLGTTGDLTENVNVTDCSAVTYMDFWGHVVPLWNVPSGLCNVVIMGEDVNVSGVPSGAQIQRVVMMLTFRAIQNNSTNPNWFIAIPLTGNTYCYFRVLQEPIHPLYNSANGITLYNNTWQVAGNTRDPGMTMFGDLDVKSIVTGNGVYAFELDCSKTAQLYLNLIDLQCGLRIYFTACALPSFLVVRGEDNGIYYRLFNESSGTWNAWEKLPGATVDSPAAAYAGNELRVVVRGMDGSSLWQGYIDVATDTFSGWTQLSGATPSAPELASSGT